jgi:hypothetical protein
VPIGPRKRSNPRTAAPCAMAGVTIRYVRQNCDDCRTNFSGLGVVLRLPRPLDVSRIGLAGPGNAIVSHASLAERIRSEESSAK